MVPWSSIWLIHKRFSSIRRLSKSAWAALSDPSTLCWLRSLKKCKPWKRGQVEKETTNKVFAGQVDTLGGSGEIPSWTSMFRLFFLFGIKWMIHGFNNWGRHHLQIDFAKLSLTVSTDWLALYSFVCSVVRLSAWWHLHLSPPYDVLAYHLVMIMTETKTYKKTNTNTKTHRHRQRQIQSASKTQCMLHIFIKSRDQVKDKDKYKDNEIYFSGVNIFQEWVFFRGEYFSGATSFQGRIFFKGEIF